MKRDRNNGADGGAARRGGHALITGGAGFVGTNLADRLLRAGHAVLVYDNLSRRGVEANLAWLVGRHRGRVKFLAADVRNPAALREAVWGADRVFHFAAQVAVTTSLADPGHDFGVNLEGTFRLLEELRRLPDPPPLLFTSTNKVYGDLPGVRLHRRGARYEAADEQYRRGVPETFPLDFHSPYGCSKGAADQYVLDYARSFGMRAAVFRMSCIYGPHQFGTEDQGWIAHFLISALEGRPVVLYGDGRQVRDALFVDDLVEAFLAATDNIDALAGQAFNIGGGPDNKLSLLELLDLIAGLHGSAPPVRHEDWRTGDQRYYVSDIGKFHRATGWLPRVPVREGVGRLYDWLAENRPPGRPHRAQRELV